MVLITLAVGWIFFRLAQGTIAPPTSRPLGWAVVVSAVFVLILALYPLQWRDSGIPGAVFTALTGMILLFTTVWGLATIIFQESESTYEDIFADLSAIFQGWKKRLGRLAAPLFWVENISALPLVRNLVGWFDLRRHRWNLVILIAVAMGLLLVLVEAMAEGMAPNLSSALLVVTVYVSLEGAGVVLGYLLFGKYLGIYRAMENGTPHGKE
jgi:hypothetical protein